MATELIGGIELDVDDGDAIHDDGLDIIDIFQLIDLFLDRVGDQFLHIQWTGTGVGNSDDDQWKIELWVLGAWHGLERQHAQQGQKRDNNQRELMVSDRLSG